MDQATLMINRVIPIVILIVVGHLIRWRRFLSDETVDDLRKIAVNLALPAVLFISFLEMDLKLTYLVIFIVMFSLCVALFALGGWLKNRLNIQHPYFPFMLTGFEYGMLGVGLFGSAYGLDRVGYIAVVDLGHEIFIWFVFLAFLLMKRDGVRRPSQLAAAFFTSPVIIGILAGIALNLLGLSTWLATAPVAGGVLASLRFLTGLTVPLILIIIGYGIKLDLRGIREAGLVIGVRLGIVIPLALVLNRFLLRGLLGLEAPFEAALFSLLVLPPPFIVPLYMGSDAGDERRYVNTVLSVYTVVSLVLFGLYFALHPGI